MSDKLREMGSDFAGVTPEDRELREGGYFREAQMEMMRERRGSVGQRRSSVRRVSVTSAEPSPTVVRNVLGVSPEEKAAADRTREFARGGSPAERFGRESVFPIVPAERNPPFRPSERGPVSSVSAPRPEPTDGVRRAIEDRSRALLSDTALAAQRQRGETLEETRRRLEVQQASASIPPVPAAPAMPRAPGRRGGAATAEARPVGRRASVPRATPMKYLGRGRLGVAKGVKPSRVAGLETSLERVSPEYYGLYGRAGTFIIYTEQGPTGRKFYRVEFQGRTFAPAFDNADQARSFIGDLKSRSEPEYAARRERMLDADRRYFTETVIAHRQHPLFVRTIDRTRPPPSRLVS